jgi:hypothetical protein
VALLGGTGTAQQNFMSYGLTIALYASILLCAVSVPVLLLLILRKLSVCEQTVLDEDEILIGMSKQPRKEIRDEDREIESIQEIGRDIVHEFRELRELLHDIFFPRPRSFQISQIDGGDMVGKIIGIVVGAVGVFKETDIPAGAVDPTGSVRKWATDDGVNTAITPSADNTTVSVAVAATAPVGGKFNLSFTDTFPDGTSATSGPVPVPFLAAAAPRPTDFLVDQVS